MTKTRRYYVCFDDSTSDPTYCGAESVYLVSSEADGGTHNPCAHPSAEFCPVIPTKSEDLRTFARYMDFEVFEKDGALCLRTSIKAER